MSLNNIQLNSSLLADMYRASLVETKKTEGKLSAKSVRANTDAEKNDTLIADPAAWKYLGEYKKNILFIVNYTVATYLPDESLSFLTSILGACKLSLGDIAILNLAKAPSILYNDVQNKFKSSLTILFGLTPEKIEMPVNFPEFQVQVFNNCVFVHTPTLEQLESDKILKSKLWVCLRKMFNLP